jgi:hypothetical protein
LSIKHTVDPRLRMHTGPTHYVQDIGKAIAEQGIATPLGEQSDRSGNVNTFSHARCFQHVPPRLPGVFQLSFDCCSDLGHLSANKEGISVALSMIFHENLECFIILIFADKILRTLRQQADCLS